MAPEAWLLVVQVLTVFFAVCAIAFIVGLIWAVRRKIVRRRGWSGFEDEYAKRKYSSTHPDDQQ